MKAVVSVMNFIMESLWH